ncbi:hypothetical protein ACUTJJ_09990, partial [Agrobacterium sp. DKPNP3]|uniref:hypothetical protein n=1 Tax=Agrobacterium sp. DKPNP3 TaxID=3457323 RepID=UPI00404437BB
FRRLDHAEKERPIRGIISDTPWDLSDIEARRAYTENRLISRGYPGRQRLLPNRLSQRRPRENKDVDEDRGKAIGHPDIRTSGKSGLAS